MYFLPLAVLMLNTQKQWPARLPTSRPPLCQIWISYNYALYFLFMASSMSASSQISSIAAVSTAL